MTSPAPAQEVAAFIFDMDGLLVDTEPLGRATMTALLRAHGCEWQPHLARGTAGMRLPEMMAVIAAAYGLTAPVDALCTAFENQFIAAVAGQVHALPGAHDLLAHGRQAGLQLALASSGWRHYVDAIIGEVGMAGCFDAVVTGDEVARGKPFPDPFLLAAERLGVAPERCVVFEDAPAGVQAARAAGMRVVAVPQGSTLHAPFPLAPDLSVPTLQDALPWLQELGVGMALASASWRTLPTQAG